MYSIRYNPIFKSSTVFISRRRLKATADTGVKNSNDQSSIHVTLFFRDNYLITGMDDTLGTTELGVTRRREFWMEAIAQLISYLLVGW